jgi:hypothetical protein
MALTVSRRLVGHSGTRTMCGSNAFGDNLGSTSSRIPAASVASSPAAGTRCDSGTGHMTASHGLRDSKYWRARSAEALARADEMHDAEAKATMVGIALSYDRMALQAEKREASHET